MFEIISKTKSLGLYMHLFIEKNNRRFKQMTKTAQASGLSVCIDMIVDSIKEAKKEVIDSTLQIDQYIRLYNPKNVIISSIFLMQDELESLKKKYPKIGFYVMVHSNIPFFGAQSEVSQRIYEAQKAGVKVILNDERANRAIPNTIYLPNIYKAQFQKPLELRDSGVFRVICSGSLRPMKNHIIQALASIKYAEKHGKKLEFHINGDRNEGGLPVLCNLNSIFRFNTRHELISIPWLEHKEFLKTLPQYDIGLQVSMSESFNIVAGDYTSQGLPMVVSKEIDWASANNQAEISDVDSIVKKMEEVLIDQESLVKINQNILRTWSKMAVEKWEKVLNSWA